MKKGRICTKPVNECLTCNGCKWWANGGPPPTGVTLRACVMKRSISARRQG